MRKTSVKKHTLTPTGWSSLRWVESSSQPICGLLFTAIKEKQRIQYARISIFSWCFFSASSFFACFLASFSCFRAARLLVIFEIMVQLCNDPNQQHSPFLSSSQRKTLLFIELAYHYSTRRLAVLHLPRLWGQALPLVRDSRSSQPLHITLAVEILPTVPLLGAGWVSFLGSVLYAHDLTRTSNYIWNIHNWTHLRFLTAEHVCYMLTIEKGTTKRETLLRLGICSICSGGSIGSIRTIA